MYSDNLGAHTIGCINFGHIYLRPKQECALDLCKYNTPLDLRFILGLKTVGDQTYNCIAICEWESKIY